MKENTKTELEKNVLNRKKIVMILREVLPVQPFTIYRNPSGASDSAHVTVKFHGFPVKVWY